MPGFFPRGKRTALATLGGTALRHTSVVDFKFSCKDMCGTTFDRCEPCASRGAQTSHPIELSISGTLQGCPYGFKVVQTPQPTSTRAAPSRLQRNLSQTRPSFYGVRGQPDTFVKYSISEGRSRFDRPCLYSAGHCLIFRSQERIVVRRPLPTGDVLGLDDDPSRKPGICGRRHAHPNCGGGE